MKDFTNEIIGCAIEVHKRLGPGLLEKVYSECLDIEMKYQGLSFDKEKPISILYRDKKLEHPLKADFIVGNTCVVELKAVEIILPVHEAQILTL